MENNKSNIKFFIGLFVLFLTTVGISYAYFTVRITGNEEASSMRLTTKNLSLIYNDVQVSSGLNQEPGWSDTKTLTITNDGSGTAIYNIVWRDLLNTIINGELVISATCTASSGSCLNMPETQVPPTTVTVNNVFVYGGVEIPVGVTHTYTITIEFKETGSNQNYNQNKSFSGTLNIADGTPTDESCFTTTNVDSTTVKITNYDATCGTDVIIPSTIGGKTAAEIFGAYYATGPTGAFYNKGLTSVVIPNTVTRIERDSFENNNLTSVIIPNSVTFVGTGAFDHNSLMAVSISENITTLYGIFQSNNLTLVNIPNGIASIGEYAFTNNQLASVMIPSGVTSIERRAFSNNYLTSITIPSDVITIGTYAFESNNLTSLVIQNGVTTIGESAFYNNPLASVTIPSSVMSIGSSAFYSVSPSNRFLESVTIEGKSSSSEFNTYGSNLWGWKSGITCVTNNTSNVENGCITWTGSGS